MTYPPDYPNPPHPSTPHTPHPSPHPSPPQASADTDHPLELQIALGTPVVDTRDETFGTVAAVAPFFCLILTDIGNPRPLHAVPWHHIAIGNVQPSARMFPQSLDRQDQLNAYARIIEAIDHARTFNSKPECTPLPVLKAARKQLMQQLRLQQA